MKRVETFEQGQEIPSDAKYIGSELNHTHGKYFFFYEVPIKKESTKKNDDLTETKITCVINYLNTTTGRNYSPKTKSTRTKIRSWINQGMTLDDFERVIRVKSEEWLNDPYWNQFLRPDTLFGPKFEGYLNSSTPSDMSNQAFDELDNILDGKDKDDD